MFEKDLIRVAQRKRGQACCTLVCWNEIEERKVAGPELGQITVDAVKVLR